MNNFIHLKQRHSAEAYATARAYLALADRSDLLPGGREQLLSFARDAQFRAQATYVSVADLHLGGER